MVIFHKKRWLLVEGAFEHGYLAVDFFFLLSGFVIAFAYEDRLASGALSFWGFLKARVVRLWPLLTLGVVLAALVNLAVIQFGSATDIYGQFRTVNDLIGILPMALVNLPALWLDDPFKLNLPRWSLFFELAANLAFAVVAVRLTDRRLAYCFIIALVVLTLALVSRASSGLIKADQVLGGTGVYYNSFLIGFLRVSAPFLGGVALYRMWARGKFPAVKIPFWALALAVVFLLSLPNFSPVGEVAYALACLLVVFPLIIVAGCQASLSPLFRPIAKVSATLSYPLYILHVPILVAVEFVLGPYPVHPRITLLVELLLCCAVALVAAYFYDTPVRRWLANRWPSRPAPTAGAARLL